MIWPPLLTALLALASGCTLFPETRSRDAIHNPFPQLKRIAVLPFYNQSNEPTLDAESVSQAYYGAVQSIPGFEVLPTGVAKDQWLRYARQFGEPTTGSDFQALARFMNVEAVVVGSVTDFDSFYPPRMAMTVQWYAANDGFHSIPAGYGLPWGTDAEEKIPRRIVREAEFELARSQLSTQTPVQDAQPIPSAHAPTLPQPTDTGLHESAEEISPMSGQTFVIDDPSVWQSPDVVGHDPTLQVLPGELDGYAMGPQGQWHPSDGQMLSEDAVMTSQLPVDWPDPTDLIPDPPSPMAPPKTVSHEPVLTHTRIYNGNDPYFTDRLSDWVETGDDARSVGWQGYLHRSDDFVRFCCYLHVVEMLESRGGSDESDLILRWPLSRY
ncbi:MAG: hypothetical protein AAGA03_13190 [Planctomycetota bacterium]